MDSDKLSAALRALPNKRRFAARHKLPARTLWRLASGSGNPTASTLKAFADALASDKKRRKA